MPRSFDIESRRRANLQAMSALDLQLPNPLPSWLPGETLFSLLSRYHRLSGNRLASDTCRALFGSPRVGCQHDFPTRLGDLCERVQGVLGDAHDLARQRTVLPFYLPLQRPHLASDAVRALVDGSTGSLKFRLGILTSRFRANHPLKACTQCMSADRWAFGTTYWHLAHQLPGVWVCVDHQAALLECQLKSTGVQRFGWVLPDESCLRLANPQIEAQALLPLTTLARIVKAWSGAAYNAFFDASKLAVAYRGQVASRYGSRALCVQARRSLSELLSEALRPIRVVPELHGLPSCGREAWLQIQRWIVAPRGGTHPLRHLAMIYWLFDDWHQFLAAYEAVPDDEPVIVVSQDVSNSRPSAKQALFLTSVREGRSISAAARLAGVTTNTGMAWAANQGIEVHYRAKKLRPEVRASLARALEAGAERAEAASLHGLSIQAVTRVLQTVPNLRESWLRARFVLARDLARNEWSNACSRLQGLSGSSIRREAPGAYAWLYRNDREWLARNRPDKRGGGDAGIARVSWDVRDVELSAKVRHVAATLSANDGANRLELWRIYQGLPELRAKLGALERLPLTRKAIQDVTGRRRTTRELKLV